MDAIAAASSSGKTEYSVADLGIPGLRHFAYKSRSHVQVTVPTFEDPYDEVEDKRRYDFIVLAVYWHSLSPRLVTLYQTLHDAIHAKSGQEGALKLQYIKTERESVMGWVGILI